MAVEPSASSMPFDPPPRKAEEWTKNAHRLIKAMHSGLAVLYNGIEDISEVEPTLASDQNDDTAMPDDTPVPDVAQAFCGHCHSLNLLLSTPTSWPVILPMNSIINVLARCLKVTTSDIKSRPSLSELAELLPGLHQSALMVLNQLVLCCGSKVLPQSRMIDDVCLQTLAGAVHLRGERKSITRESAYRVIGLMVAKFGWGRYLQSLSWGLVQELISDIRLQEASKEDSAANRAQQNPEVELIAQRKGKKKKKGKKSKGDSYSDLPVSAGTGNGDTAEIKLFNVQATQAALELSSLIVQRAEYAQIQALVQCLLETSRTLQREGPPVASPYTAEDCREALYAAISSCATIRLGRDCNRKDTISHAQATNLALSVLSNASCMDTSPKVKVGCSHWLVRLRSFGNQNRPIVRRILPDGHTDTRDVAEVEREAERLEEENRGLWKQLVDAQLEIENQKREVEALRKEASLGKFNQVIDENAKKSSNTSKEIVSESTKGTASDSEKEEECSSSDIEREEGVSIETVKKNSSQRQEKVSSNEKEEQDDPDEGSISHGHFEKENITNQSALSTSTTKKKKKKRALDALTDKTSKKAKTVSSDSLTEVKPSSSSQSQDASNESPHAVKPSSSSQSQDASNESPHAGDDVEAMILDFVDAAPDEM